MSRTECVSGSKENNNNNICVKDAKIERQTKKKKHIKRWCEKTHEVKGKVCMWNTVKPSSLKALSLSVQQLEL